MKVQESIQVEIARNKYLGSKMNRHLASNSLIDLIGVKLRIELNKLKIKDHFIRNMEIQESNCKILGVKFKSL
jgi:hypothetical protein